MWRNLFKPEHQSWRWVFCFSLAIYIHLFINICEPYKGDKITYIWASTEMYIWHSLFNFANVFFFTTISMILLPKYRPKYFLSQNFTLERFIFIIACSSIGIGIGYFIGNHYFFQYEITLLWFLIYIFKVISTNVLFAGVPFIIAFLLLFDYYKIKNSPEIENSYSPKNALPPHEAPPQYDDRLAPVIVHFTDTSNKKTLDIPLENLYYITSAQNYIEIVYQSDNLVKTVLLRNSLKMIEEEMILSADSPLIRCHKAFIVNREKIKELRGSTKNAHFILTDVETLIPVSRNKFAEIESQFSLN